MRITKFKFERFYFLNRWKQPKHSRNGDWIIFGVFKWWCSWDSFCYMIGFFGFEIRIWFKARNGE